MENGHPLLDSHLSRKTLTSLKLANACNTLWGVQAQSTPVPLRVDCPFAFQAE